MTDSESDQTKVKLKHKCKHYAALEFISGVFGNQRINPNDTDDL